MQYEWILFDADETLFSFDAFQGLKTLFSTYGVTFTSDDYAQYQKINYPLWQQYQNGEITSHQLQTIRFAAWAKRLSVSESELNEQYQLTMATICQPFVGVKSLLTQLKQKTQLGIITNGFSKLQEIRLQNTGLDGLFDLLVVSEEVGYAKPDSRIFAHAYEQMGQPHKNKVLMIGDNPDSDILGGNRFGFDTCWLNWHDRDGSNVKATYQVRDWADLAQLLTGVYEN